MPRKKKKPKYNPIKSMEELLTEVADAYGSFDDRKSDKHEPSLNALAVEYDLNVIKVRKLLITAGVYSTATSRQIAELALDGLSEDEISERMELSKASVNSYLPYESIAYKMPETSVGADRARIYRLRCEAVKRLKREIVRGWDENSDRASIEKDLLWKCVLLFERYRFLTAKELPFTYEVKKTKSGEKSGELVFSRKSKGVTRSTVDLAYERVIEEREKQGTMVPVLRTPKDLKVFGASYLYAMFLRFNLISADPRG